MFLPVCPRFYANPNLRQPIHKKTLLGEYCKMLLLKITRVSRRLKIKMASRLKVSCMIAAICLCNQTLTCCIYVGHNNK